MIYGKNINIYYFKYLIYFLIGITALVFVDIYQLEVPKITGDIIDSIDKNTLTIQMLKDSMFQIAIVVAIMFTGRFLWRFCIFGNGVRIESDLREKMFRHSSKLSQRYYQENKTGALMALYTNDLQTIRASFGQGTVMLVDVVFLGTLAFIKMWKLAWILSLISAVPLLLLAICGGIIGKYMRNKFTLRQKAFANLSDFTQESFSGISVIKAFVKEAKELLRFRKINQENMDRNIEFVRASVLLQVVIGLLISSIIVIILGYGGYLVYQSKIHNLSEADAFTIGELTEFLSYFGTLTWPMMAIAQLINLRSQAMASLKRVNGLLGEEPEIVDPKDPDSHRIEGKIAFNHLSFTYPESETEVLHDITFTIQKGESIGVIGRTGSGKTTLVDLLLRIYNLSSSQILIDDVDIMNYRIRDVRDAIAYVPQDNFLFSDTIENNIGFAFDVQDNEKVKEAAALADVDSNISEFKEGYQTVLGERGVTVSGGQKQRISIARALIRDAKILILDDSVSAVDTKTEEKILSNLRQTRIGKTTILIAHRISTIKNMDKIVLIDEGRLVGFGTHNQLLKTCPLYEEMVRLQKLEDEVEGNGK
jgi:ATP-binding cassette subfamily B protein